MHKNCAALSLCLFAFPVFLAAQPTCTPDKPCVCDPPIAGDPLDALKAGNLRYAGSAQTRPDPKHLHQSVQCGNSLICCQRPFAVILGCSDSRVPPEVLFDLGNGDLFVVREAGNVATPAGLGSIEYAVEHLKSKLVVVMGHKRCGAVEAAFCPKPPPYIGTLWTLIRPAVPPPWRRPSCDDHPVIDPAQWDTAVHNNVDNMAGIVARDLTRDPKWRGATVVRAYYDLENGTVSFFEGVPKK